jgi:threonine synthase
MSNHKHHTGLINRYRDRLPVNDNTRVITLNEGNTPLIKLENIPKLIGKDVVRR